MGGVLVGRDERLGRNVAIKQIGTLPGETAPDLARAMREARSSAALHHPHVVSIYDVLEEGDHIWLVMEYVASRTLWQIITQDGPLSPEAVSGIGAQIAEGLAAAHAVGTIHRDVKPSNILVTAAEVAKISDFGIARGSDQGQLTSTGLVIGTPEYFSPQLARGEDPTPADDVFPPPPPRGGAPPPGGGVRGAGAALDPGGGGPPAVPPSRERPRPAGDDRAHATAAGAECGLPHRADRPHARSEP